MNTIIDINWDALNEIGEEFQIQASNLENIVKELKDEYSLVREVWRGEDADSYLKQANNLVKEIKKESKYLKNWSKYLTCSAKMYKDNVMKGLLDADISVDN